MSSLGLHFLVDLHGVAPSLLNDIEVLNEVLVNAIKTGGATVVDSKFNKFEPQGVSGVVIIAESHVTCHTWPEIEFAAVDVFTCGDPKIGQSVCREIIAALSPVNHNIKQIKRGVTGEL